MEEKDAPIEAASVPKVERRGTIAGGFSTGAEDYLTFKEYTPVKVGDRVDLMYPDGTVRLPRAQIKLTLASQFYVHNEVGSIEYQLYANEGGSWRKAKELSPDPVVKGE